MQPRGKYRPEKAPALRSHLESRRPPARHAPPAPRAPRPGSSKPSGLPAARPPRPPRAARAPGTFLAFPGAVGVPRLRRAGEGAPFAACRPHPLAVPSRSPACSSLPGLRGSPRLPGRAENVTPQRSPALRPFPHTRQPRVRGPSAQAASGSSSPTRPPSQGPSCPSRRAALAPPPTPDGSSAPSPVPARFRPRRLAPSSAQTSSGTPVQQMRGDMARPPVSPPVPGSPPLPPLRPAGARRTVAPHGRRLRTGRPGRHWRTGGRPARSSIWRGAGPAPGGAPGFRAATPARACRPAARRAWRARPGERAHRLARQLLRGERWVTRGRQGT